MEFGKEPPEAGWEVHGAPKELVGIEVFVLCAEGLR